MDVGKLTLGVTWDGEKVAATDIRSTRPLAAQVLKGKTPAQVLQIVPLLFSVCGQAQGAAASAALQAAQQAGPAVTGATERTIVCEAMQEHLWRLLLDWPKLLGLERQEQRFAGWYALLRRIGAGETGMEVFMREFEHEALGMPAAAWRGMTSHAELQAWWQRTESPLAGTLAKLAELGQEQGVNESRLLPAWSAAGAQRACAGRWDAAFAARPVWQGAAAETGAWAYHADKPVLRDAWRQGRSKALVRLLARAMDTVEMACGDNSARLDAASPAAGEGIAVVRTARGLLLHRVRLVADKVADYMIVAPTEWNFHPDGAFAQDMRGLQEHDGGMLEYRTQIEALSLDPCVAYEIEIQDANGRP